MTKITLTGNETPKVLLTTEGHAIRLGDVTVLLDAVQFADLLDALHDYTAGTQRTWTLV